MTSASFLKSIQKIRGLIFITAVILLLISNILLSLKHALPLIRKRARAPYVFIGDQFQGILDIVKGSARIGYYTDKSIDDLYNAAQFAQAQYILAPVLLELNALAHPFIIFDLKNPQSGLKQVETLGMIPLRQSPSGIIIAKNPEYHTP